MKKGDNMESYPLICRFSGNDADAGGLIDGKVACEDCLDK